MTVGPALLAVLHHSVLVLGVDPHVPAADQGAGQGGMYRGPGQGGTGIVIVIPVSGVRSLESGQGVTGTRRYGPLRGPTSSSCGGLRPLAEAFFALSGKKRAFYAVLVSSSNHGNI